METLRNSTSLLDRLLSGEIVSCPECSNGKIKPFNPRFSAKDNHSFVCNQCGMTIHWDPVVEIE